MPDEWAFKAPAFSAIPDYEHTDGPQVAALCEQIGFGPDPEQRLILDALFALRPTGRTDSNGETVWQSAAFETCVVAPRQNLKTGVMKMALLGWLFITQEKLITWSAHEFDTTRESFRDVEILLTNSPMLRKRLAGGPSNGIHGGRGDEHIELADGRRVKFKARTKTGARGLTGDKIILDEAFALQPEHTGSIYPTLTVVPDPQLLIGSSAGMARSRILRDIRDRGRSPKPSSRLAYFEWCAERRPCLDRHGRVNRQCQHFKPSHPLHEPGCALDDPELMAQANTLLGRHRANGTGLTVEKMRDFREAEDPDEWMRERLGWWEEAGADELFGEGRWIACRGEVPTSVEPIAFALAVTPEQSAGSLCGVGRLGDRWAILPAGHDADLRALQAAAPSGIPVVIDSGGPAANLIAPLRRRGVRVVEANLGDCADAYADMVRAVGAKEIVHAGFPELEDAVSVATTRAVGDRTVLGRRKSSGDITMIEAAVLALWQATRPSKPPPPPATPPQQFSRASSGIDVASIGF
ncbi:hypothetical protein CGZ93_17860 [Enemella dayhoffiae]|uniref:Terminase n=1 Tax=Enemella dayhoffiae TaxID=2016507 RepID=A0A255GPY1_9ACTN|nr:hypothetical protein [Enemella dayhoffiae]OYO16626.1 hypothetical protein CGZ93_17860 [Enemella dayhoffiae]